MTGRGRRAAVMLPVFALRGERDWGVGEFAELVAFGRWLRRARHGALHVLPFLERPAGERSPYAALTAFALDPIHLSMRDIEDFVAVGGEPSLEQADRLHVATMRGALGGDGEAVRAIKGRALARAFAWFEAHEAATASARSRAFAGFCEREAGWLGDFVLFRALRDEARGAPWWEWTDEVRRRWAPRIHREQARLASACRFHAWLQWLAAEQWDRARRECAGIRLVGDLPFGVAQDSADVWAAQEEFDVGGSVGAPPDQFDAAGQDWGLPPCRWDVAATNAFAWMRRRVGRMAALVDGCRVDHVVGYFRTWTRSGDGEAPGFVPAEEGAQRARGEGILAAARAAAGAMDLIAEDLGSIPDFVRESMRDLDLPGYRVLRWERDGGRFRDPGTYPARSVATTGTHDTSTVAAWWEEELSPEGRKELAGTAGFSRLPPDRSRCDGEVLEAILDGVYGAGSDEVVLPFQDAYGGRERINLPATVGPHNWTYRLPWTVEQLAGPGGRALADRLAGLARRHRRAG